MAIFSVVGTPIGNLDDITLRALAVLKRADVILCEDTRVTKKLLSHYQISTKTISYHAHSKLSRENEIISLLREGRNIAMVSDAGTPGISDPGAHLVSEIRSELAEEISNGEIKLESIPGPSALTAALAIAGVPCADFVFMGFLPHKKGRETLFNEIKACERTVVFYESPHRVMKTLESLTKYLDGTNKKVTICRELTKVFEEVVKGTPREVKKYFETNSDHLRGEFVGIVSE